MSGSDNPLGIQYFSGQRGSLFFDRFPHVFAYHIFNMVVKCDGVMVSLSAAVSFIPVYAKVCRIR